MVIKCYFKYICLASRKSYYSTPPFLPSPPTPHYPSPRTIQKSKFAPEARMLHRSRTKSLQGRSDHKRLQNGRQPQLFIIHYSLFIIHHSLHHSPQKNRADSRPLRLIIFCLLLYPLTAQDLRKQRQDRQYSYKLCRMCSYRPQRNIRYPDHRTDADRH